MFDLIQFEDRVSLVEFKNKVYDKIRNLGYEILNDELYLYKKLKINPSPIHTTYKKKQMCEYYIENNSTYYIIRLVFIDIDETLLYVEYVDDNDLLYDLFNSVDAHYISCDEEVENEINNEEINNEEELKNIIKTYIRDDKITILNKDDLKKRIQFHSRGCMLSNLNN